MRVTLLAVVPFLAAALAQTTATPAAPGQSSISENLDATFTLPVEAPSSTPPPVGDDHDDHDGEDDHHDDGDDGHHHDDDDAAGTGSLPPSPTDSVGCSAHGDHWDCEGPRETGGAAAGGDAADGTEEPGSEPTGAASMMRVGAAGVIPALGVVAAVLYI